MPRQTTMLKKTDVKPRWHHVDAEGRVLGRIATEIATILMGKHRPQYTPHVLCGDAVVVINAKDVKLTGKKWEKKEYTWFTGYTGLRKETAERRMSRHPDRILRDAVRRMLPKNKLATKMLQRLKIYPGAEHPHQAQEPQALELVKK